MKFFKKMLSSLLVLAFALSLASCDAKPEEVKPVIDTYAKCIQYMDSARILENTEPVDDAAAAAFTEKLTFSDKDYDQANVKETIAKSITYTVNEATLTTKGKSATCNVTFTRKDYEAAFSGLVGYPEAYLKALNDCTDNKSFDITFTFNKDQAGRWLATSDSLAKLNDLYSFMDKKFEFGPDTTDLFDRTSWLFAEDGKYQNTTSIELDIWFTDNPEKNFYYVVSKDNVEVYKSEPKANEDIFFRAIYNKALGATTNSAGFLDQGVYNIKIFREDGLPLADESIKVIVDGAKGSPSMTKAPKGASFTIKDASFAIIKNVGWWDYDGTLISEGTYCINTKTLAFSVQLLSEGDPVYYAYYFVPGEKADTKKVDYSKPVYENTISPFLYFDGSLFYNFDYAPETMEVGKYVLVIAKDKDSIDKPYITATCKILPQSSEEFV